MIYLPLNRSWIKKRMFKYCIECAKTNLVLFYEQITVSITFLSSSIWPELTSLCDLYRIDTNESHLSHIFPS
jgi:hypothetical protein